MYKIGKYNFENFVVRKEDCYWLVYYGKRLVKKCRTKKEAFAFCFVNSKGSLVVDTKDA